MLTDFGGYLMILVVFLFTTFFVIILKSKLPRPKYENSFPGGKIFLDGTFKRFEEMRETNNPSNEPVGINNGRCQFCGSTKIDQEWKTLISHNQGKKFVKNCNSCNFVVASMS